MISCDTPCSRDRNKESLSFASSIIGGFGDDCDAKFNEAYVSFVKRHFRHMRSWFERFRQIREQDREDAVHDFFLSIRRKVRTPRSRYVLQSFIDDPISGKIKFRNWLWQIAKHSSVDFVRARKNKIESVAGHAFDDIRFGKLLCDQIELLLRDDFETMLNQTGSRVVGLSLGGGSSVSSTDWEVFVLGFWTPKSDLAKQFGKTEHAIEQSLYRARKGLNMIRSEMINHYGLTDRVAITDYEETI